MSRNPDAELRGRLLGLEATMPLSRPPRARRSSRLLAAGAAVALLASAFAGGAVAREIAQQSAWRSSGVFTPGGPLHCSDLQNMKPREAAPLLEALGYRVLWQDEHVPGARVVQTEVPPEGGFLTEGISKGRDLILLADPAPVPASRCE